MARWAVLAVEPAHPKEITFSEYLHFVCYFIMLSAKDLARLGLVRVSVVTNMIYVFYNTIIISPPSMLSSSSSSSSSSFSIFYTHVGIHIYTHVHIYTHTHTYISPPPSPVDSSSCRLTVRTSTF
ncbi:hypothetical protein EON63_01855 [archaeon]|nr:MAG: hypothetical protein EON63_01855 [archaeon]